MNKLITLGTVSGETKTLKQAAVLFPNDGQTVIKDGHAFLCASRPDAGEALPQCLG